MEQEATVKLISLAKSLTCDALSSRSAAPSGRAAQIADMLLIDINKRLIQCIWYRLISYQWFQFATGDRE